jgi:hypothetical protein
MEADDWRAMVGCPTMRRCRTTATTRAKGKRAQLRTPGLTWATEPGSGGENRLLDPM